MDELATIQYADYNIDLPKSGKHIIGVETKEGVIVFQAFRPSIAKFALENQFFGGDFKLTRMSWIKTNFLWMMYRSGWASKSGQEHILAVEIKKDGFYKILSEAVCSSFDQTKYSSEEKWRDALSRSYVRLQWDPDHTPSGKKLERKAIQLGLKGEFLERYSADWIISIRDISDFVRQQGEKVLEGKIDELLVIKENVITTPYEISELG